MRTAFLHQNGVRQRIGTSQVVGVQRYAAALERTPVCKDHAQFDSRQHTHSQLDSGYMLKLVMWMIRLLEVACNFCISIHNFVIIIFFIFVLLKKLLKEKYINILIIEEDPLDQKEISVIFCHHLSSQKMQIIKFTA